jgi:hypothetical protein
LRLPKETQPTYLINPFELHYFKVSAENFIAIDTKGSENKLLLISLDKFQSIRYQQA